jgi:hypothetical protein
MKIARIAMAGALAVLATNAWAAGSAPASASSKPKFDATGTWNAKMEGRGPPMNMVFVFKQEKDKLTGTMSTNGAPPVEIENAKLYKTKITFAVKRTMPPMQMPGAPPPKTPPAPVEVVTKYEATVDGDTMTIETVGGGMGMGMGGGGMGGGMGGPPPGGGGGGDMGGGMGGPPPGGGMGGGMGGPPPGGMGGMGKITATRQK